MSVQEPLLFMSDSSHKQEYKLVGNWLTEQTNWTNNGFGSVVKRHRGFGFDLISVESGGSEDYVFFYEKDFENGGLKSYKLLNPGERELNTIGNVGVLNSPSSGDELRAYRINYQNISEVVEGERRYGAIEFIADEQPSQFFYNPTPNEANGFGLRVAVGDNNGFVIGTDSKLHYYSFATVGEPYLYGTLDISTASGIYYGIRFQEIHYASGAFFVEWFEGDENYPQFKVGWLDVTGSELKIVPVKDLDDLGIDGLQGNFTDVHFFGNAPKERVSVDLYSSAEEGTIVCLLEKDSNFNGLGPAWYIKAFWRIDDDENVRRAFWETDTTIKALGYIKNTDEVALKKIYFDEVSLDGNLGDNIVESVDTYKLPMADFSWSTRIFVSDLFGDTYIGDPETNAVMYIGTEEL